MHHMWKVELQAWSMKFSCLPCLNRSLPICALYKQTRILLLKAAAPVQLYSLKRQNKLVADSSLYINAVKNILWLQHLEFALTADAIQLATQLPRSRLRHSLNRVPVIRAHPATSCRGKVRHVHSKFLVPFSFP